MPSLFFCGCENIYLACVDFFYFPFLFKYFLKVMVSRVVGTCFPRNLAMGMRVLGPETRWWRKIVGHRSHVVMENMAGAAAGKIEVPLGREIGEDTHGKTLMALRIFPGGHQM